MATIQSLDLPKDELDAIQNQAEDERRSVSATLTKVFKDVLDKELKPKSNKKKKKTSKK